MPCSPSRLEKFVRHLQQDAGAVASERIAPAGAAVRQVHQDFEPLPHDLMAFRAMHVDDEAHTAGIVLESGVVQTFTLSRIEWKLRLHGRHRTKTFEL